MKKKLLTENLRRLLGIAPREFGGVPAMFQQGQYEAPLPEEREPENVGSDEPVEESDT